MAVIGRESNIPIVSGIIDFTKRGGFGIVWIFLKFIHISYMNNLKK